MSRRRLALAGALATGLAVGLSTLLSCGGNDQTQTPATPTSPTPPVQTGGPAGTPPVLADAHPGTRNPLCGVCHVLPVAGHTATVPSLCVSCHGANGACNPNGRPEVRSHAASDNCLNCHQQHHGFTANAQCASCHFAAAGRRVCGGGGGPNIPGTLTSGCFGWPATEFSPSNKATVQTFLQPGSRAVDFALRDANGVAYTLSGLLATRPVLLVHGAFT
jgi:hypothetical protein